MQAKKKYLNAVDLMLCTVSSFNPQNQNNNNNIPDITFTAEHKLNLSGDSEYDGNIHVGPKPRDDITAFYERSNNPQRQLNRMRAG